MIGRLAAIGLVLIGFSCVSEAFAQEVAGRVVRLQGDASEVLGNTRVALAVGSPVHRNGTVETGKDARAELAFLDDSRLTLGAEARVGLDELVYDMRPDSRRSEQAIRVVAGTFKFLSGAIGKQMPQAVAFTTPVATIGIRGTEFFGGPLASGMPPGQFHYGFMILDGAIAVDTPQGGVTLDDPNEGTFLPMSGGAAPTPPATWAQDSIDEAFASIAFR
ncbi:MAG: FecR domain-containing protein [Alphaproteobacteria bacterium]